MYGWIYRMDRSGNTMRKKQPTSTGQMDDQMEEGLVFLWTNLANGLMSRAVIAQLSSVKSNPHTLIKLIKPNQRAVK